MRRIALILGILFSAPAWAQLDTLVQVVGTIVNAETKEPIVARVEYKSLPYGSRMGFVSGSSFTFPMYDNSHYSITVVANGFAPSKYLIDPSEADESGKIIKRIELASATNSSVVGSVRRLDNLIFEQGRAKMNPESYPELNHLAELMIENRNMVIQLEGHTDYLGNAAKNMKLSEQRVEAVKDYLISQGVHKSQVQIKAFGGTAPLSRDDTPEAHALNRRVEVRILKN